MMSVSLSQLREVLPNEGLFEAKDWRLSPAPFPISVELFEWEKGEIRAVGLFERP